MNPAYSPTQRTAVLCILAYMATYTDGSAEELQAIMAEKLRLIFSLHELQALIGSWEVVWGPAIYQAPGSRVADNSMFAAHCPADHQFVISIAGTNPFSWFNWLFEDFPVRRKEHWPTYAGEPAGLQPKISQGTATGLRILQAMEANGRTLIDYLRQHMTQHPHFLTITVTGHSLGGALSPAIAIYLADTQHIWDPAHHAQLSVMPMAGPTPGDLDFARYSQQMLNGRIQRIWNDKDIVPHAWDKSQMSKLPTLYHPDIKPNWLVRLIIAITRSIANRNDYTHLQPDAPPLPGHVVPTEQARTLLPPSLIQKISPKYMVQVGYQHLAAYYPLLQLDDFAQIMGTSLPDVLTGPDLEELRRRVAAQ